VFKRSVVLLALIVVASLVHAQGGGSDVLPFKSVGEAAGLDTTSRAMVKHGGGNGLPRTSDGRPHAFKTAGVVIVQANTDESGVSQCTEPYEEMVVPGPMGDLVFWRAPLHRLVFKAKPKRSKFLEIIWSGQINVYSGFTDPMGNQYQSAFLECTVTQKGRTVPCSGTDWKPALVQDLTTNGLSSWVTYHGYVEFNPKKDAKVELWLWSWPFDAETYAGLVNACGDTLTLKY
jgi:hypothetical protein